MSVPYGEPSGRRPRPRSTAAGSARRRGHHRLQRHRRRHPLHAAAGRRARPRRRVVPARRGLAGGVLAFAGAMAYAELAALRPQRRRRVRLPARSVRPLAAFLTGWTSFVAGFSGAIAASAVVFAFYLGRFVPGAGDSTPLARHSAARLVPLTFSPQTLDRDRRHRADGVRPHPRRRPGPHGAATCSPRSRSRRSCCSSRSACRSAPATSATSTRRRAVPAAGWLLALVPVMFTLLGLERRGVRRRGDSRSRPERAARAGARHGRRSSSIYLLLNALYLYVMPVDELAALQRQRARRRRRSAARARRPATSWRSSRSSASPRASAR